MKVSKRSLIVSIAVLCVCALSLTAASFAWFSASESARVDSLTLGVNSQSDIKIAINPAALDTPNSAYWVTKLDSEAVKAYVGDYYIGDVTPETANTCNGKFLAPTEEARERVLANGAIDGFDAADDLVAASAGEGSFYAFTIYVRTTGNAKGVTYNATGFSLKDTSVNATKTVLDAMRLGDNMSTNISDKTGSGVVTFVEASDLEEFKDGYYTTQLTFYIWVEGTDAACKNSNAASVYDYVNTITFGYAE